MSFVCRPAPKNEDEMMVDIFEYIDRIFAICRPRKLLYMAIDGVVITSENNLIFHYAHGMFSSFRYRHIGLKNIVDLLWYLGPSQN